MAPVWPGAAQLTVQICALPQGSRQVISCSRGGRQGVHTQVRAQARRAFCSQAPAVHSRESASSSEDGTRTAPRDCRLRNGGGCTAAAVLRAPHLPPTWSRRTRRRRTGRWRGAPPESRAPAGRSRRQQEVSRRQQHMWTPWRRHVAGWSFRTLGACRKKQTNADVWKLAPESCRVLLQDFGSLQGLAGHRTSVHSCPAVEVQQLALSAAKRTPTMPRPLPR